MRKLSLSPSRTTTPSCPKVSLFGWCWMIWLLWIITGTSTTTVSAHRDGGRGRGSIFDFDNRNWGSSSNNPISTKTKHVSAFLTMPTNRRRKRRTIDYWGGGGSGSTSDQQYRPTMFKVESKSPSRITTCQLFFKSTDESSKKRIQEEQPIKLVPPMGILETLACPNITFPYTIPLDQKKKRPVTTNIRPTKAESSSSSSSSFIPSSNNSYSLTIRQMRFDDLEVAILPMCIKEFGYGPTTYLTDLISTPTWWRSSRTLSQWFDRFTLEPLVWLSLTSKLWVQESSSSSRFSDPTLLVLCLNEQQEETPRSSQYSFQEKDDNDATTTTKTTTTIIGMIEWSLQPAEAKRNPPGFPPIPLWMKQLYCQLVPDGLSDPTPQGWITNLLIHPDHRGCGYSKLLVSAVEGITRSWNNNVILPAVNNMKDKDNHKKGATTTYHSIYLHADADTRGGQIPQALYEGMGFELILESCQSQQESSDGEDDFNMFFDSRIHMVDGAPLLFYCKQLYNNNK